MEILIKIPDKWFVDMVKEEFTKVDELCAIIQHGTVLPKGHGRLIEANHFNTDCGIRAIDCLGKCEKCSDCVVKYEDICNAKTIIEADIKNEREEK